MYQCFIIILSLTIFVSCKNEAKNKYATAKINHLNQYDFDMPSDVIELPKALKEISGFSFINDSVIAVISDSNPYLYFYNIFQRKIINSIEIASGGDFEDVAVCGDTAFVMQSNGKIWMVANYNKIPVISFFSLPLTPPFELEGLCHNQTKDTLFIAAKYWHEEDNTALNELPIWAFSIKQMKLVEEPIFYVSTEIASDKKKHLFHTSALKKVGNPAFWIVVSTNKKFVAQLDFNGVKDAIIPLESKEFIQPEGIDINSYGTIYISNEGGDGKGTLLAFKKR